MASTRLTAVHRQFIALLGANNFNLDATCRAFGIVRDTAQKWMRQKEFKEELSRRQEILAAAANVTGVEVMGILASQLRADIADILPDEEIVKEARKRGVSHLIHSIEIKTITRKGGDEEKTVKIKMVDATKAAIQLSKLLCLEIRDDAKERARTAIRGIMDLNKCTAEEAIAVLAPHNPVVAQLRDEFCNGPVIDILKLAEGDSDQ